MQDLNDLYYFAQVVGHGGFAAAGRALGIPKSTLSRRVSDLERRLGVRLLQRSTRRFAVTEIGREYHRHCLAVIAEAEAAQEAVERTTTEPRGTVRVSCPVPLLHSHVAAMVPRYLAAAPRVRVVIEPTNRRVDVIEEGFDVALRVRLPPIEDEGLVMRVLSENRQALVASPALLDRVGRPAAPEDLSRFDSLAMARPDHAWHLSGPRGEIRLPHRPRLVVDDMATLRQAALDGVGVVQLPGFLVAGDIARGTLEMLLPDWSSPSGIVHAVFPSRRGLLPSVRGFIDFLAHEFRTVPTC